MRATLPLSLVLLLACATGTDTSGKDSGDTDTGDDTDTAETGDSGSVNTAPTAPGVAITPAAPNDAADLVATITADATDADGDPLTYRFAWTQNGADRADLTTATVGADQTTDGDTWAVSVFASDGTVEGAAGTSTATVGNFPPSAPVIHLDPVVPAAGDDITLVFDTPADDANGDVVTQTIEWYRNGARNVSWDGRTDIDGAYVDGGDTYRVVVTVTDGYSDPIAVEASVSIANSAPVIDSIAISPSSPGDTDDLSCVVRVTDDDGGTPTKVYTWFRDGVEATDIGDSSSVTADFTTVGESWECEVEASDGVDTVTMMSAAEVIQPPTGYRQTMNLEVTVYEDTAGSYTADGTIDVDVNSSGSRWATNDCYVVWSIVADKDTHCRGCTYTFEADYTYEASMSSIVTGCTGLYTDSAGELDYDGRSATVTGELTDASLSMYAYYYGSYPYTFRVSGTGGYGYSGYGYTFGNYYSVVETYDAYGNTVITAYSTEYRYY